MVELGSRALREVPDYHLTRYACYLIAQNGDPRKEDLYGEYNVTSEHVQNNQSVRSMLLQRGIEPENCLFQKI
ncbi:MAG: hypothetical protein LBB91_10680 [Clostridiales bacterium]|jgi:hypothetical protein|nr:hypothetical protein [Clostridiales bacterium]